MKNLKLAVIIMTVVTMVSCSSSSSISNGGFSDISLTRDASQYELKRLQEISEEGKALFGIPTRTDKTKGIIVRFNGINLGKSNQIGPILTMVVSTFGIGSAINGIVGTNNDYRSSNYGKDKIGLPLSMVAAVPFAGALNNAMWSGGALKNATWNVNSRLVQDNPDVDIFLNPKYEVEQTQGIFTQKATVKARVMGATIKINE
ncbi:hypothetical protein SCB49_03354 [unidentified eubacterium SCB49]|nr:hypothetical protein SCB49_03354 [unidentified eubacterium SCB49]